ncbi:MAG: S8 family serine peptidase [Armatimonadetes bacterium]|nr:S8 family serine peptidase [Armatimonadota bacterium]
MLRTSTLSLVALFLLAGCGGGGNSGSSIIDPANDPTCSSNVIARPQGDNASLLAEPGVIVPSSTVARAADIGYRAHTNHLINASSVGRGTGPTGLTPDQLRTAYSIPADLGSGAIAIVDAYHYPSALNDFNVFSTEFGLPTESSSDPNGTSNAVFQVVYASGSQPTVDTSWSQESAIDTQWAHAMAPHAKIYLVEAASNSLADLMAAVNVAKNIVGVKQVSMSFGATEDGCLYVHYNANLTKSGVTFFAAAGDTSGELDFPSLSKNCVAVGGTRLTLTTGDARLAETAWTKTGGGLSTLEPRPTFQNVVVDFVQRYRGAADVSAVGDPATGVSVYDSTPDGGLSGWITFGGTSVACPIIAAIVNAADNNWTSSQAFNTNLYNQITTGALFDVKAGKSGALSATTGWDFLTGVGSPNGLTGF